MDKLAILTIDQGTTSSRAIAFSLSGDIIAISQREFTQYYPKNGWVEHDPEEIWTSVQSVVEETIAKTESAGYTIKTLGITNQRETTLVWDRKTGTPIYNAIVWQDRRTADVCDSLASHLSTVTDKTGLLLDPYFSATKISWMLDHVEGARERAEQGELAFGTIDSFLIWRLTAGKVHATDATNASRTNLYNIYKGEWDEGLLEIFSVPSGVLPNVKNSADDFGITVTESIGLELPINGVAGDQQAALFGQCCFDKGDIKSTYGTGCFVLMNTGQDPLKSTHKMLTTIAYQLDGNTVYALEGAIFTAGANVQWLRDSIQVIQSASETEALAESLDWDHGVFMVPAFAGLGAPHWEPEARATVFGMTRDTTSAHLARSALESVCFQTSDLLEAMYKDGAHKGKLWVDGGMVHNNWLCQNLADIINVDVNRPAMMESTALGAAYLAGLYTGLYKDLGEIHKNKKLCTAFQSKMSESVRTKLISKWEKAVEATLAFASVD